MTERKVEGTNAAGFVDDLVPDVVAELAGQELGSREQVEAEIDLMLRTVREFWNLEPDQVMRMVSALSARCTELYIHLHRVEGSRREWRQVRTQQVERLLEELDRQYKLASRAVEVRRQDLETLR